ncbi:MAG TPA: hypothetical protein VF752_16620 [Thermoleophilaceae bacterium]
MSEMERLLRSALVPVDPPGTLVDRLEARLTEQLDAAAEELADWELRSMRNPRNWVRPVAASVALGLAGGALVVVRTRQQQKRRSATGVKAIQKSVNEVAGDVRRRLNR